MKSMDENSSTQAHIFNRENNREGPKFLEKVKFQIGVKKFLWLKKLKILCHGHVLLVNLTLKKLLERFTEKNC